MRRRSAIRRTRSSRPNPLLKPDPFPRLKPIEPPAPIISRGVIGRGDRLEMRSYQPYSGLQYGFRPPPQTEHGVKTDRPEIVQPIPLAPLIETPTPFTALWYAYCAEKYRSFEPSTGTYTTHGGRTRRCR